MIFFILQTYPFIINIYTKNYNNTKFKINTIKNIINKLQHPLYQSIIKKIKKK